MPARFLLEAVAEVFSGSELLTPKEDASVVESVRVYLPFLSAPDLLPNSYSTEF